MSSWEPVFPPLTALRGQVGCVIPVWFSATLPIEEATRLLWGTVAGLDTVLDPEDVLLVVDGSQVGLAAARAVKAHGEGGLRVLALSENRGKGGALATGFRALAATRPHLAWIAARDADGDHLIEDLPHLYRACRQARAVVGHDGVAGIGRRIRVDAPLGWVRAECEWLLNEVSVEAISALLARQGAAWDSRFLADRVPDIQSGYKLYTAWAAGRAAEALEGAARETADLDLLRIGMELVPFVALARDGGVWVEAERRALFDQPVSSYAQEKFARFYGNKLAWVLLACATPPVAAATMLDGALTRRALFCDGAGRALLLELRERVLTRLGAGDLASVPPVTRQFV